MPIIDYKIIDGTKLAGDRQENVQKSVEEQLNYLPKSVLVMLLVQIMKEFWIVKEQVEIIIKELNNEN